MVICMVTNNYTPYAGGVVHAIQTYTQALQAQGHTVYIITLDFGVTDDPWYVLRIPSCVRFQFRENIMSIPWRMYQHVTDFIDICRPDVVHIHSPFLLGKAGLRAARRRNIPVVFTYHSLYERFVSYVPVPQRVIQKLVLCRVNSFCQQVNAVIAPSTYIMHRVCNVVPEHMVWYLPTPIRSTFFNTPVRVGSVPSRYIICVARFQPEKQIDQVIDAFVYTREQIDVTLVLIGFGASYDYLQWYAYTYHGLPHDAVQFVIKPDERALISWYRTAAVFVSASPEAQGLVFAEACACGLPIIAYQTGGAADIVREGKNGFLVTDPYSMANRIKKIYHNATLWQHMARNALEVAQWYNPQYRTDHIMMMYKHICTKYEG